MRRGAGPEPDRIKSFINTLGEEWVARCPADPGLVARKLLTALCNESRWDEALKFADSLARHALAGAAEMAAMVRLRRALERGSRGELEDAERELAELEVTIHSERNNDVEPE